jgi:hypothetical protein
MVKGAATATKNPARFPERGQGVRQGLAHAGGAPPREPSISKASRARELSWRCRDEDLTERRSKGYMDNIFVERPVEPELPSWGSTI